MGIVIVAQLGSCCWLIVLRKLHGNQQSSRTAVDKRACKIREVLFIIQYTSISGKTISMLLTKPCDNTIIIFDRKFKVLVLIVLHFNRLTVS